MREKNKPIHVFIVDNSSGKNPAIADYLSQSDQFQIAGIDTGMKSASFTHLGVLPEPFVVVMLMSDSPHCDILWIKKMKKTYADLRIIVLSEYNYVLFFHTLMEAGVNNILNMDTKPEQVAQVIECTLDGHFFLPYSFYHLLNHISSVFTEVEIQTLELIALEYTNAQMAKELNVTIRTVESRLTKIYDKLEVSSRRGAVKKIMQMK